MFGRLCLLRRCREQRIDYLYLSRRTLLASTSFASSTWSSSKRDPHRSSPLLPDRYLRITKLASATTGPGRTHGVEDRHSRHGLALLLLLGSVEPVGPKVDREAVDLPLDRKMLHFAEALRVVRRGRSSLLGNRSFASVEDRAPHLTAPVLFQAVRSAGVSSAVPSPFLNSSPRTSVISATGCQAFMAS